MDEPKHSISSHDVYRLIGSHPEPIVIALGQLADLSRVGQFVVPTDPSSSNNIEQWRADLLTGDPVTFFDGGEQIAAGFAWHYGQWGSRRLF